MTVVILYHDHATMDRHHGELKTDLGIERLPSGKFETNRLDLQLGYATNVALRLGGDRALQCDAGVSPRDSRSVQNRLRLRTVLERYILCPTGLSGTSAGSRLSSATAIPTSRPSRRSMPNASLWMHLRALFRRPL